MAGSLPSEMAFQSVVLPTPSATPASFTLQVILPGGSAGGGGGAGGADGLRLGRDLLENVDRRAQMLAECEHAHRGAQTAPRRVALTASQSPQSRLRQRVARLA